MPNEVGIMPRKELIPLTINANYLVGYQFTDNMQLRFVKDFDNKLWFGLSLENPATSLAPGTPATVNGLTVGYHKAAIRQMSRVTELSLASSSAMRSIPPAAPKRAMTVRSAVSLDATKSAASDRAPSKARAALRSMRAAPSC